MNQIDINEKFIETLESRIPKKTELANFIAEKLFIEKETAYRRLRGEVQFSLREVALIACSLNISIEEIMIKENMKEAGRNSMQLPINQTSPELDHLYITSTINFLKKITSDPYSEYALALTHITFSLFYRYSALTRFHILKNSYNTNKQNKKKVFNSIRETEKLTQKRKNLNTLYRKIKRTYHIWDPKIIPALINDILYFKNIHLISNEEVKKLKEELYQFLADLEELTTDGIYKDTGNSFELYISELTIDHTYAYLYSDYHQISMSTAFVNYEIISHDETTFQNVKTWIKSMLQSSTLISGSAEKEKVKFFNQQYQMVDHL
ncbi:MAG: hypothetical protein LBV72_19115 [Tannerella sp.]|jgi:hypothetical protein|nr:hypothetical protein [Tannerella sp.]